MLRRAAAARSHPAAEGRAAPLSIRAGRVSASPAPPFQLATARPPCRAPARPHPPPRMRGGFTSGAQAFSPAHARCSPGAGGGAVATSVGVPGKMAAAGDGRSAAGRALCLVLLCGWAMAARGLQASGELGRAWAGAEGAPRPWFVVCLFFSLGSDFGLKIGPVPSEPPGR